MRLPGLYCGAPTAATGEACRKPAGWGTERPGEGRCRYHPGAESLVLPAATPEAVGEALRSDLPGQAAAVAVDAAKLLRQGRRRRPPLREMSQGELQAYLRSQEAVAALVVAAVPSGGS